MIEVGPRKRCTGTTKTPRTTLRRQGRMVPADRRSIIVKEATRFFAEYGLHASTLALARKIGITQPLLYKYFPTKMALIEQVFAELFPSDWSRKWEQLLDDTTLPPAERITRFYIEFSAQVFTYQHVRLFLFSGLSKNNFNRCYYAHLTEHVFTRIVRLLRQDSGVSGPTCCADDVEMELVQSLHAAIYHIAFRRFVHMPSLKYPMPGMIERKVAFFLDGARGTMKRLSGPGSLKERRVLGPVVK